MPFIAYRLLCHAWLRLMLKGQFDWFNCNLIMSSLGSNSFTLTSPTLIAYLSRGYTTYSFLFWTLPIDTKGFKYWTKQQPLKHRQVY